jgi:hypothetical protein
MTSSSTLTTRHTEGGGSSVSQGWAGLKSPGLGWAEEGLGLSISRAEP